MESNNNNNNNPNVSRSNANSNETGLNLSEFDGIVLGVFKDGTLSQTIGSNKLPENFQQIIKKKNLNIMDVAKENWVNVNCCMELITSMLMIKLLLVLTVLMVS